METICIVTKETLNWDECLNCALSQENDCGWSYGLLKSIRDHQGKERGGIHVTGLTQCLLKTAYEIEQGKQPCEPSDSMYTWIGTAVHEKLESSDHHVLAELPVSMKVGDAEILGTVDAYYPEARRIVDYKTTRYINPSRLPYGSHVEQISIYALMLRSMGLGVESAAVQYIDLTGPQKCRSCKGTVKDGVCQRCGREQDAHNGAMLFEVDLMDMEDYVEERAGIVQEAISGGALPVGEPGFLCSYCPFRDMCDYAT